MKQQKQEGQRSQAMHAKLRINPSPFHPTAFIISLTSQSYHSQLDSCVVFSWHKWEMDGCLYLFIQSVKLRMSKGPISIHTVFNSWPVLPGCECVALCFPHCSPNRSTQPCSKVPCALYKYSNTSCCQTATQM